MKTVRAFEPKWATPPGATVFDLLNERKLAVGYLAHESRRDIHEVSRLLFGLAPLTEEWAQILSRVFGSSESFWLRREELYRSALKSQFGEAPKNWLGQLPVRDMVRFGWIDPGESADDAIANAFAFLGVTTPTAFERKYERLLFASAYRKSNAFQTDAAAVAAWLRKGEIEAAAIDCAPWSPARLREALDDVRNLTRVANPNEFLPALQRRLADCGVAAVLARAPQGCRASGATRFISSEKALLQLSFRYLSDDQFWFTVFHEIGHLLLHASPEVFLEGLEDRYSTPEKEADLFALQTLFSKVGEASLDELPPNKFSVARLAKRAGVAPGIVVGELQQRGRIPFKHFNYLKVRYAWEQ